MNRRNLVISLIILGLLWKLGVYPKLAPYLARPFAAKECSDVYCNDYEFICCTPNYVAESMVGYRINTPWYRKCPYHATRCEVTQTNVYTAGSYYGIGKENCRQVTAGIWPLRYKRWACDDEVKYQIEHRDHTLEPGQYIYPWNADIKLDYIIYKKKLGWCGSSPCDPATRYYRVVRGSEYCSFVTTENVYYENGRLMKDVKPGQRRSIAISVTNEARCLIAFTGRRHVCGSTCEKCKTDKDCAAGHTRLSSSQVSNLGLPYKYVGLGAECSGGNLVIYGCRDYGTEPTEEDINVLPGERSPTVDYGTRCENIKRVGVECCGGTRTVTCPDGTVITTKECVNYEWVETGEICVLECHPGETKTKTCPDGTVITTKECVNYEWVETGETCPVIPKPSPPSLWDQILSIWADFINWLRSLFGFQMAAKEETIELDKGTSVSKSITLDVSGLSIDKDYSDGSVAYLHKCYVLLPKDETDLSKYIKRECVEMGTLDGSMTSSFTLDQESDLYFFLTKQSGNYNYGTRSWEWSTKILEERSKVVHYRFKVTVPTPPGIWQGISMIFARFLSWLRRLFGW